MADRRTLHKNKLDEFKKYLDLNCIAYRHGKGTYQVLQVLTGEGWQTIYERNDMPEHFTVQDKLMPTVKRFLNNNNVDEFQDYWDKQIKRLQKYKTHMQMNEMFDECEKAFKAGRKH